MKTATVYDVQHNFSRVLDWVKTGETVVISRNRVPVAQLVPLERAVSGGPLPDFMARLRKVYGRKAAKPLPSVLDELREDRY